MLRTLMLAALVAFGATSVTAHAETERGWTRASSIRNPAVATKTTKSSKSAWKAKAKRKRVARKSTKSKRSKSHSKSHSKPKVEKRPMLI